MKLSQFNTVRKSDAGYLVMNTRSNGILSLNPDYALKFENIERFDFAGSEDLVAELEKGGMLIDDARAEYDELLLQSRAARFSNASLGLTIAPTMACNFCCPYCYEKGQAYTTMSDETIDQLVSFVKDNYPNISELFVGWYGGEPLLGIDKIQIITERLKGAIPEGCGYRSSIVTNGYLLTPEVAQLLKECGVSDAQVTLDGSRKDHDSRRILHNGSPTYDRILANVKDCADILSISIRSNVDRTNIASATELLDYLEKNDIKNKVQFYIAPVDDINEVCANDSHCFSVQEFSEEEVSFYEKAMQRGFKIAPFGGTNFGICCAVALNSFVVDPLGDLYKCWDDIGRSERKVGNISEPPMLTQNMIRWMNYEPKDEDCKSCFAMPMCMGGCPNIALNGDKKQCVSFRYNAEQKILLAQKMKAMESKK